MKRRSFLGLIGGVAVAPLVVAKEAVAARPVVTFGHLPRFPSQPAVAKMKFYEPWVVPRDEIRGLETVIDRRTASFTVKTES